MFDLGSVGTTTGDSGSVPPPPALPPPSERAIFLPLSSSDRRFSGNHPSKMREEEKN